LAPRVAERLAGRDFTDDDRTNGAVIVNQQFAREFFQWDALGKAFQFFAFE
jgi:hypothetical protein